MDVADVVSLRVTNHQIVKQRVLGRIIFNMAEGLAVLAKATDMKKRAALGLLLVHEIVGRVHFRLLVSAAAAADVRLAAVRLAR